MAYGVSPMYTAEKEKHGFDRKITEVLIGNMYDVWWRAKWWCMVTCLSKLRKKQAAVKSSIPRWFCALWCSFQVLLSYPNIENCIINLHWALRPPKELPSKTITKIIKKQQVDPSMFSQCLACNPRCVVGQKHLKKTKAWRFSSCSSFNSWCTAISEVDGTVPTYWFNL